MKENEVIDKVVEKLKVVYAYSAEDIVRDSRNCRCDIIVNYPASDKPFVFVETKSFIREYNAIEAAKNQVKSLLSSTDIAPIFVMLTDCHSSLCYMVDKSSSALLRPVDDIPFRYGTGLVIKQTVKVDDVSTSLNMAYESLWTDGSMQQLKAFDEINKLLLCILYHELVRFEGPKVEPLLNYLLAADGGIDDLKNIIRNELSIEFDNAKEYYPRIFNDEIAIEKNKLLYALALLQDIHISGERSREILSKGYEMFAARVLGEGKVNRQVLNFIAKSVEVKDKRTLLLPYGRGILHSLLEENNKEKKTEIYGVDINQRHVQTSKIKRIMKCGTPAGVEVGEGLSNKYSDMNSIKIQNMLYDIIISIPPTDKQIKADAVYTDEYELFQKGIGFDVMDTTKTGLRTKQNIEVLFLEKCYRNLREGGIAAIILPDAILENKNMQYVRDWLVTHFKVMAIVSLPKDSVKTKQKTTKSSFLLLKRFPNHIVEKQRELLSNLREQFSSSKIRKDEYADRILEAYSQRVTEIVPEYSVMLFDVTENKEKDFEEVLERLKTIDC